MMGDIWDEKPKAIYQGTWHSGEPDDKIYESVDMDAWLEKVKLEFAEMKDVILKIEDLKEQRWVKLLAENVLLKEKAEKWDHMISSDPTTGSYINRRIMEKKLEAVKAHWDKQPSTRDEEEFHYWWLEMDKILEGEAPPSDNLSWLMGLYEKYAEETASDNIDPYYGDVKDVSAFIEWVKRMEVNG